MEHLTRQEIKQKRLDNLFEECKSTVISSSLSAFGLNSGMFTDRDGGNVTTEHNFLREDNKFVHERDHDRFTMANQEYQRKMYEKKTSEWGKKRAEKIEKGVDDYTGESLEQSKKYDLDHITPLNHIHKEKKGIHLALKTDTAEGREKLQDIVNDDNNLAITNGSINKSKGHNTNTEYLKRRKKTSNQEFEKNLEENMVKKQAESENYIESQKKQELNKKQKDELLETGVSQATNMAIKQALGILSTKVINILFNEVKLIVREENALSVGSFENIKKRLANHAIDLAKSVPDILVQAVQGGISGFISNLLTFLINNFISTVKRLVTIIRESLLGVYKSLKILFFPPEGMSKEDKWREAIKLFSTTVITAVVTSFSEKIIAFISALPFSDILGNVLAGLFSGLLSALAAYIIDMIFDKLFDRYDEEMIEQQLNNTKQQNILVNEIINQLDIRFRNIESYDVLIDKNKLISSNMNEGLNYTNHTKKRTKNILDEYKLLISDNNNYISKVNNIKMETEHIMNELDLFLSKYDIQGESK